jgi:hypothetical protein
MLPLAGMLATVGVQSGCARRGPRAPEKLRDTYVEALEAGDPKAAYALLAPQVRATVPYDRFESRWRAATTERAETIAGTKRLDDAHRQPVYAGTTAHAGGRVLQWIALDDRYVVVSGLPGIARTTTPAQAVRALIEAVRTTDLSRIRAMLGDAFAHAVQEDWEARAEAMEAALDRPGAIELSSDLRRAELRYEPNRVLTLEQTPAGWRVTSLE